MPLIKVQTNTAQPHEDATQQLLRDLSSMLADTLGKSEAYVMTMLEPSCPMTFGGSNEPACYMEVKNIGNMTAEQTQQISETACTCVEKHLRVAPSRTYIEFNDAQRHLWGWNSKNFASRRAGAGFPDLEPSALLQMPGFGPDKGPNTLNPQS